MFYFVLDSDIEKAEQAEFSPPKQCSLSVSNYISCECDIEETAGGIVVTSGTNLGLVLKDELIRFWWSRVMVTCYLTKYDFGHYSRFYLLIMTKFHANVC